MEALILIPVLFVIGLPAMMIVALVKLGRLQDEMSAMKRMVAKLEGGSSRPQECCPQNSQKSCGPKQSGDERREESDAPQAPRPPSMGKAEAAPTAEASSRQVAKVQSRPACELPGGRTCQPTALDVFWKKVEDWFAVRGEFAPRGVTHEFAFATRWLVRVGVALVSASIVYFVKLSVDRGWMGPAGRVAMTVFWGSVASVGGAYLVKRTRYGVIGHAVAALGVVALYVGFGLGHRFFDPPVIPSAPLAFAALFGVTLYAGFTAVVMPSPFIAVMALLGGYAVPVIAGRDTGSPFGLCAYLLLIDAMAFYVARFRRWSALDFLSATVAYATMFVWCGGHARLATGPALAVFAFFTAVHAIYMFGVVIDSGKRGKAGNAIAFAGLAVNACAYLSYLASHFRAGFSSEFAGLVFLALVAAYVSVAAYGKRSGRLDGTAVNVILVFALAFLSIAPLLLFGSPWWSVSWCAIAVAASEAEARTHERILGCLSIVVFALAAAYGIFGVAPEAYETTVCGGLQTAGYWKAMALRSVRIWTLPVAAALIGRRSRGWLYRVACVMGFALYTLEAQAFGAAYLPSLGGGMVTVAWFLLAFVGVYAGIVRRMRAVRIWALSLLGVSVAKLLLCDTARLATPARVALFALCGVLLIVGAFLYIKFRERFVENEEGR